MKPELRYISGLEIRSTAGQARKVTGYALKFNLLSQDLGGFVEKIDARALEAADLSDVVALFNHDKNLILARTTSRTLKLSVDSIGLKYEFTAPETTAGNDLLESISRGDITGSSFGFIITKNGDTWDYTGAVPVRTITNIKQIIDVSPVVFPAYQSTEVYRRMQESLQESLQEFRSLNPEIKVKNTMKRELSLLGAVKETVNGKHSKELQTINKRGEEIAKGLGISTTGNLIIPLEERDITASGSNLIADNVIFDFVTPFRNELVLTKAGAKYIPNCLANFSIPKFNGVTVTWEAENDSANDGSNTFDRVSFSPKRLTAYVTVSNMLLNQTNGQAEELLKQDIVQAIIQKVEETAFGKHAHSAKMPDGFFTGIADAALKIKGAPTRNKLLDLEFTVKNTSRENRAFILNEAGAKALKSIQKVIGYPSYLLEGNQINDNQEFTTNNIPGGLATAGNEEGIIYGNWSEFIIAQFGVIDILANPFSKAGAGAVELIVNAYFDFKPRNSDAFAVGSLLPS